MKVIPTADDSENEDFFNQTKECVTNNPISRLLVDDSTIRNVVIFRILTKFVIGKHFIQKALEFQKKSSSESKVVEHVSLRDVVKIHGMPDFDSIILVDNVNHELLTNSYESSVFTPHCNIQKLCSFIKSYSLSVSNEKRLDMFQPVFRGVNFIKRDTVYKDNSYFNINDVIDDLDYNFIGLFSVAMSIHKSNKRLIRNIDDTTYQHDVTGSSSLTKLVFFTFPSTSTQITEEHKISVNAITSKVLDLSSYGDIIFRLNKILFKLIEKTSESKGIELADLYCRAVFSDNAVDLSSKLQNDLQRNFGMSEDFNFDWIKDHQSLLDTANNKAELLGIVSSGLTPSFYSFLIDSYKSRDDETEVKEIYKQHQQEVVGALKAIVQGNGVPEELKEYENFLCKTAYLIFVCEPIRNPSALIHSAMLFSLLEQCAITFKDMMNLFPMSKENAVAASNTLSVVYNQCFKEKNYPTYYYGGKKMGEAKNIAKIETSLVEKYTNYKQIGSSNNLIVEIASDLKSLFSLTEEVNADDVVSITNDMHLLGVN